MNPYVQAWNEHFKEDEFNNTITSVSPADAVDTFIRYELDFAQRQLVKIKATIDGIQAVMNDDMDAFAIFANDIVALRKDEIPSKWKD